MGCSWLGNIIQVDVGDSMRLPIPKLVRDVCDHYKIAPSQLILNAWRILIALKSVSVHHGVECEIGEVLFSYYLKEYDTDKGRYQLIVRVGQVPIITCLHTNDCSWKYMFFFVKGELMYGLRGPGDVSGHCRTTSKRIYV